MYNLKTVILAGGLGTRLRSVIGENTPKPMALIAGKPFLEHQIRGLKEQGLENIILCVYYKADAIKSYFGDGRQKFDVEITYSEEETPLGTAGAIKKAEKYIDDSFFVLNGDSISKLDLKEFLEFHRAKKSIASMGLFQISDSSHYGQVVMDGNKIINFLEKSSGNDALVNSGAYIFEPKIFDYINPEKNVSLEKEIFPVLAAERKLFGYHYEGYFIDIGRPETYARFKKEALEDLVTTPNINLREALKKMKQKGKDSLLIVSPEGNLLGVLNDHIIRDYLIEGGNVNSLISEAMVTSLEKVGRIGDSEEKIREMLLSGTRHLPILDDGGKLMDIRFRAEEIKDNFYPIMRGKVPLRISFSGGGIDLPQFFEKYGGVAISTTIDKYCHVSLRKRADSKLIINSDLKKEESVFDIREIKYDGNFDLIKAVVNLVKPDFGFDIYLHNDVPPGRGLGSSASLAVLIAKLLTQLKGVEYSDDKIADLAYKAERSELKIAGGWQDQYAAVMGGFNYMEFEKDKHIRYPLRLKESTINELAAHLSLCYVGKTHSSGEHQTVLEKNISEEEIVKRMNKMKDIAIEIKDSLLTNGLQRIGPLLDESWRNKRELSKGMSNPYIDGLYETGMKNGAQGGRLLGAGGGGYLLFYHEPESRNRLTNALREFGGEIMQFNFESKGAEIWASKV